MKTPYRKLENNYINKQVTKFFDREIPLSSFAIESDKRKPGEEAVRDAAINFFSENFRKYDTDQSAAAFIIKIEARIQAAKNIDFEKLNRGRDEARTYKEKLLIKQIERSIIYQGKQEAKRQKLTRPDQVKKKGFNRFEPNTGAPYFMLKSNGFYGLLAQADKATDPKRGVFPLKNVVIIDRIINGTEEKPELLVFGPGQVEEAISAADRIIAKISDIGGKTKGEGKGKGKAKPKRKTKGEGKTKGKGKKTSSASDAKYTSSIEVEPDNTATYTIEFYI